MQHKYNCWCKTKDCPANKNYTIVESEYEMEEVTGEELECPYCGEELKIMGVKMSGRLGGNFSALSQQDKKKVLKKRSHEHNQKSKDAFHQKNRKDYMP